MNSVMALILRFSSISVASGTQCVKLVEGLVVKKFKFAISSPDEFLFLLFLTSFKLFFKFSRDNMPGSPSGAATLGCRMFVTAILEYLPSANPA